jgi:hypothetical protein
MFTKHDNPVPEGLVPSRAPGVLIELPRELAKVAFITWVESNEDRGQVELRSLKPECSVY